MYDLSPYHKCGTLQGLNGIQEEQRLLNGSETFRECGKLLPDRVRYLNKSVDMSHMLSRADLEIELDPTVIKV